MQLPKKLLAAASTDQTRIVLHSAMIDADNRRIVTTNGRIMCAIPIPGDAPIMPGYITPEMLNIAKARNKRALEYDYAAGTINGEPIVTPEGFYEKFGTYPNYQQVIPTDLPVYRIVLNPKYIQAIADGFGTESDAGLTFEFTNDGLCPAIIRQGESLAVIMPMRGATESGLLVASDKDAEKLRKEVASLHKALSERSDIAHTPAAEADVKVIDDLRNALFQERARVKELEAKLSGNAKPADPKATLAPAPKPKREVGLAIGPPTIGRNAEKDGIELRFNGKPDDATRASLKAHGFRWCPGQPGQPWAAKYTEERWIFANHLATGSAYTPMPEPETSPETTPQNAPQASPHVPDPRVRKIHIPDF